MQEVNLRIYFLPFYSLAWIKRNFLTYNLVVQTLIYLYDSTLEWGMLPALVILQYSADTRRM